MLEGKLPPPLPHVVYDNKVTKSPGDSGFTSSIPKGAIHYIPIAEVKYFEH